MFSIVCSQPLFFNVKSFVIFVSEQVQAKTVGNLLRLVSLTRLPTNSIRDSPVILVLTYGRKQEGHKPQIASQKGSLQKIIEMSKSIEITKHPLKTLKNAEKKSTVKDINHFKHKGYSHTRDKKVEETTCTKLKTKKLVVRK